MKTALLLGACLLSLHAAAQTAPPADPAHDQKIADIRKLMTLTGGDKMASQMLDQMAASMRASGGPEFEKYFAEFRKEFDLSKVGELQVQAYDKYLSAEDVRAMVGFYESAPGKRMIAAMPQIMGDMMAQAMEMSQEIARKVAEKMKAQKTPDQQ
jgi:hypothetical protein